MSVTPRKPVAAMEDYLSMSASASSANISTSDFNSSRSKTKMTAETTTASSLRSLDSSSSSGSGSNPASILTSAPHGNRSPQIQPPVIVAFTLWTPRNAAEGQDRIITSRSLLEPPVPTPAGPQSHQYNETLAYQFVELCGCTYCCIHGCNTCTARTSLKVTSIHSQIHDGHGFVAFDEPTNTIYLAFTGTDPLALQDWLDDLNFFPEPFPDCEGCWVDRGFYHTYLELREQMLAALGAYHREYPTAVLHLTGHSLGGALAVFAALELIHTLKLRVISMYTFGQPRIGNVPFQKFIQASLEASSCAHFRVTHSRDPVPHLPPSLPPAHSYGFRHEPQEVYYPCGTGRGVGGWSGSSSNSSSSGNDDSCAFVVCDPEEGEDPRGSDQNEFPLNFVDHITYLGFPFTLNYLQCEFSSVGESGRRKEPEPFLRRHKAVGSL